MKRIMIDGVPVDVSDDQGAAIIDRHVNQLTKLLTDAKKASDDKDDELEKGKKEMDDAKTVISAKDGEIAVLKKKLADAEVTPEKLDVMVKDRLSVIDAATPLLDKAYVFDGKTLVDIKRAAVDAYLGDAAKGMDEGAIAGAFVAATMDAKKQGGGSQPIRRALFAGGRQPVGDARQTAFDERNKRLENAYKTPVRNAN
jgi:hypothetical protein